MLPSTYEGQQCSIARALEIVGERWTLLLLRDAFLGTRRFDDFQTRLGISRNVLARRMAHLVEAGLFHRRLYHERPTRYEYLLTQRARDLWPVLLALARWGEDDACAHRVRATPDFVHTECDHPVEVVVQCPRCDVEIALADVSTTEKPAHGVRR